MVRVHPVQPEDFDEWLRLRQAVYKGLDPQFHREEIELFCEDPSKHCLLAFDEHGNACGMVEVSLRNVVDGCLSSPVGYIEGIVVDPARRGTGVGRQLLHHAEDWCRGQGCTEIGTDSELDNTAGQQFHRHMGFEETYRVVGYRKSL